MFDSEGSWLDRLNPAQRDAVTHRGSSLLVVAGAGTGKTFTLACRVAHLIAEGTSPERILLLTFTRRAAREMLGRAARLVGRAGTGRVWGGTFHAVANRILRLYGRPIGVRPDFTVLDKADAADLMNLIRGELDLGTRRRRFPKKDTLAAIYSRTVNAGEKLPAVVQTHFPWCTDEVDGIRRIFDAFVKRKRRQNVLDFDDLLLHWRELVDAPAAAQRVAGLFDHVLVDEYQDTNALQADILTSLGRGACEVMAVGDDAQAIYSFRSATVRNILEFPQVFPGTRVVKLEQNYRSTEPVLAVSNAVIALSPQRHEKTLWSRRPSDRRPTLMTCLDESEQCDLVCRSILDHREEGKLLRQQAVLFRAAHHSDMLEVEMARRNIPFVKYGGLKFLEAAHVKDVLALLRILENPFDEVSWFRVLQLLEGVGPAAARSVIDRLGIRAGVELESSSSSDGSPIKRLLEDPPAGPPGAAASMEELRSALADCSRAVDVSDGSGGSAPLLPAAAQIDRLRRFLEPVIQRLYSSPASRLRDLEQLEAMASASSSRGRFIAELTFDPPMSTGDLAGPPLLDEDYVVLSTIHSAKGCEWDVVHIIHAADGMIPSDMATGSSEETEEERRLLYVAMTRAKDVLVVYFPLRYYRRGHDLDDAHSYAQLTRFIPADVRSLFDQQSAFAGQSWDDQAGDERAPTGGRERVDAYLTRLWSE
jgi:DNA helicase-2/ATP-dependent DNA helicase PcrA